MMKKLVLSLVLAVLAGPLSNGADPVLIIKGGTLVDVLKGQSVANIAIVVEGKTIKEVITDQSKPLPEGQVIDATGKSILPGLIDAHVHYRNFSPPLFLYFGVTSVFDFGNPGEWIKAQAQAHENGTIQGPRIFFVGNMLQAPLGEGERYSTGERDEGFYRIVTTPEEISSAVMEQKNLGASAIKLHERHSTELLKGIASKAREVGLPLVGHLGKVDPRVAAAAGFRCVVHTGGMEWALVRDPASLQQLRTGKVQRPQALWEAQYFAETIQSMVANDVCLNPTLENNWGMVAPQAEKHRKFETEFLNRHEVSFVPAEWRNRFLAWFDRYKNDAAGAEEAKKGYANVQAFVKQFIASGGKVVAGSDSYALPMGSGLRRELELLVDTGLTPMQAIQAATINSALLFRLEDTLGSIAPGKLADILIVDGGLSDLITDIARPITVIKDGRVVDTTLKPSFVNPIPLKNFLKPVAY
ncbi:MAG: amidohydrolase family protein [Acidobacteria bacterium]|nr:amidohydrolase family protein [Acidobacteriota bacterium]